MIAPRQPRSATAAALRAPVPACAARCRGAAQGEGLGNAFLSNITAVDGIFHVLRTFEDADITHVEDRVDPVEDMHIIHAELRAKDLERCGKLIEARCRAKASCPAPALDLPCTLKVHACALMAAWRRCGRHAMPWRAATMPGAARLLAVLRHAYDIGPGGQALQHAFCQGRVLSSLESA